MHDEEARRQATAARGKVHHRPDPERRPTRESRTVPAPGANAELASSLQKRQGQSYSHSEKFNPQHEDSASGFPIDPPTPSKAMEEDQTNNLHKQASYSGPLVQRAAWSKVGKKVESNGPDLSAMSGIVAARKSMLYEDRRDGDKTGTSQPPQRLISRFPGSLKEAFSNAAGHQMLMMMEEQLTKILLMFLQWLVRELDGYIVGPKSFIVTCNKIKIRKSDG